MAVWLVTGGTGFLGRHLMEVLERERPADTTLALLGRRAPPWWTGAFVSADLDDPGGLARPLTPMAPAVVFHLAGRTPPAKPEEYYRGNTLATLHLLDALRSLGRPVRVVLAGSAAELGPVAADALPVGEDYPCRPSDSYGLSKLLATTAGLSARPPLEVIVARIFNPIGPGLPYSQAFGRFAAELARPGLVPLHLTVGDLESRRDFIDVRDVARALLALAKEGRPGTLYHVGTGQSQRVGDGLEHLVRRSGWPVTIDVDPQITECADRKGAPSDSRADISRIKSDTGWRPAIDWRQSLDDLWNAYGRDAKGPPSG
jgi:GDP-4-dehydro-6-deoxy-D-mannose reductase